MDDVGADVEGFDVVEIVEIVFEIEFVHPEGCAEGGVVRWLGGRRADEGECEGRSVGEGRGMVSGRVWMRLR